MTAEMQLMVGTTTRGVAMVGLPEERTLVPGLELRDGGLRTTQTFGRALQFALTMRTGARTKPDVDTRGAGISLVTRRLLTTTMSTG